MKHRLTLDYQLGEGALKPFLDGLVVGVAEAGWCPVCDRVTFPPETKCLSSDNGMASPTGWRRLSGKGTIEHLTTGIAGCFALVRFDGASNRAVCNVSGLAAAGDRVTLAPSGSGKPALIVRLLRNEREDIETID